MIVSASRRDSNDPKTPSPPHRAGGSIMKIGPLRYLLTLTCFCLASCSGSSSPTIQASGALSSPLPANTPITVTLPSGFTYSYSTAASGITETTIGANMSTGIGINFFTERSYFIDLVSNIEGWK
jgi:hypothetical protein